MFILFKISLKCVTQTGLGFASVSVHSFALSLTIGTGHHTNGTRENYQKLDKYCN